MNGFLQQTPLERQIYPHHAALIPELNSRPRVLIGEGDNLARQNLKELLNLYNIGVLEAENGEEAIELTVQKRPDLILLNTELKKLDGFETVQIIRNIRAFDEMPIIFLCNETARIFRKRAFAVGGDSFHIAPLDLERMDYILEQFLYARFRA